MNDPRLSVVVPAYDVEDWIEETLYSVIAQTVPHTELEIILVDDGSTDGTLDIARQLLAGCGVEYSILENHRSRGPSAARNRGWRSARGTWIQFLDADDLLDPEKIAIQMRAAGDAEAQVAALFSPWGRLIHTPDGWSRDTSWVDPSVGADALLDVLRADNFIATGSQIFRRTWLEEAGGYLDDYAVIQDVELLMRIVMRGGLLRRVPSDRPLFWYRKRPGSLTSQKRRVFIEECLRNAELAEAYWQEQDVLSPMRSEFLAELYVHGARFFAEHDPSRCDDLVRRIYRLHPGFVPRGPAGLRWLTRLVGYREAERVAVRYRRFKRAVGAS